MCCIVGMYLLSMDHAKKWLGPNGSEQIYNHGIANKTNQSFALENFVHGRGFFWFVNSCLQ